MACNVEGCETREDRSRDAGRFRRGLCRAHYMRLRRYGDPTYRPPHVYRGGGGPRVPAELVLEEWEMLGGRTRADIALIAPRIGMSPRALERALERARLRGDLPTRLWQQAG